MGKALPALPASRTDTSLCPGRSTSDLEAAVDDLNSWPPVTHEEGLQAAPLWPRPAS